MNATAVKEAAEAAFKPAAPKIHETPAQKTEAKYEGVSTAELRRRADELHNLILARVEAERAEVEEQYRHEFEKDKEDALRLIKKIHERGGVREHFIEFASKANGAFSPDLIFERNLPVAYLPEEYRPAGVSVIGKKRTGGGGGARGAASRLSEKAPERGAGSETQEEIIVRVVNEGKGKEMTLEEVIHGISIDEVFGAYLKKEPRGLSRKIGGVAKRGLIKKTADGKYVPA